MMTIEEISAGSPIFIVLTLLVAIDFTIPVSANSIRLTCLLLSLLTTTFLNNPVTEIHSTCYIYIFLAAFTAVLNPIPQLRTFQKTIRLLPISSLCFLLPFSPTIRISTFFLCILTVGYLDLRQANTTASSSTHQLPTTTPTTWSESECKLFLRSRVVDDDTISLLSSQRINGKSLLKLDLSALLQLKIPFGVAIDLLEEIDKLKVRGGGGISNRYNDEIHAERERKRYSRYNMDSEENGNNGNAMSSKLLDEFTNKPKAAEAREPVDPNFDFENAAESLKSRFGDFPLPTPRMSTQPDANNVELTPLPTPNPTPNPTPTPTPPTPPKPKNDYDQPFANLPSDLLNMMPPDVRAIAERNPSLVAKAMKQSSEKTSSSVVKVTPQPVKLLTTVQENSLKRSSYSERFIGAAAALEVNNNNDKEGGGEAGAHPPPPQHVYIEVEDNDEQDDDMGASLL